MIKIKYIDKTPIQEPIKLEPEDEKIMMETTLYMLERFKGGKHGEITKNAK